MKKYLLASLVVLVFGFMFANVTQAVEPVVPVLTAQDFGVMDFSGVMGYTAGFHLEGADLTDAEIVVELYSGSTLLQTNTALPGKFTGTDFSGPFDVTGTFDYMTDGYWSNERGDEFGANLIPTKVVATVVLADLTELTAENTNLTGDPSTVMPGGALAAENFNVVNSDTGGWGVLKGYTSGFALTGDTWDHATSVVVELYAGSDLLQTDTAIFPLFGTIGGPQISAPFDVLGNFNYVTDGYWTNERESEYGKNIVPTKVKARVKLASGKIVTAENTLLTGVTTIIVPPGTLAAENFNVVVNSNTGPAGILSGYSTGFRLDDALWADAASLVVRLYAGSDLLQTDTANFPLFGTIVGGQISAPFDVSGTFNYALDGYWSNSRENEYGQTVVPTKVVATATLANGKVMTAQNTNLTDAEDAEEIMPVTFEINYIAGANGTIDGYENQNVVLGGTTSEVTAVPNNGFHFTGWSDGVSSASRSEVNVTAGLEVTANFEENSSGGSSGGSMRNVNN